MTRRRRTVLLAAGIITLLFGLGCLNFTEAGGLKRHRASARRHGFPEPSRTIFLFGVASTALGAGVTGYAVGRSSRTLRYGKD